MTKRVAQVSQEAEAAVLGAILLVPDNLYDHEITDKLQPADFGVRRHQAIYAAILACEADGRPYHDLVVLADELERRGDLVRSGGREYLSALLTAPGEEQSLSTHIDIVREKSILRNVALVGQELIAESTKVDADGEHVLEAAESAVFRLGDRSQVHRFMPMSEAVPKVVDALKTSRGARLLGVPTGFKSIDDMTAGLQPGQLVIVAARPGMGKTSIALQMARHMAETSGDYAAIASYEMGRDELLQRMLSTSVGLSLSEIRMGALNEEQETAVVKALDTMRGLPMLIEEMPPPTAPGLRSLLRRTARRYPLSVIVIDYLQLMSGTTNKETRTQEITEVTRTLKLLARELEVPVIALSQLNRAVENRASDQWRPRLSDLRESGSVEQDADIVMFITREVVYNPYAGAEDAELIIAKQRSGATGIVNMRFVGKCTRFEDRGLQRPGEGKGGQPVQRKNNGGALNNAPY